MKRRRSEMNRSQRGGRSLSCAPNAEWRKIRPYKLDLILQSSPPGEDVQEKHAWNPDDRSPNVFVKDDDKFTACLEDEGQEGYIKGKMGYSRGFHVWQLNWNWLGARPCFVGVATKDAMPSSFGFDQESYGWNIALDKFYHDANSFPSWRLPAVKKGLGYSKKLYCILDMDEGFLAFATDETYLGVAFRGLKGKTLYPVVSDSSYEVTMKYLGGLNGSSSTESDGSKGVENPARGDDNSANQLAEDEIKENSTESDESDDVENPAIGFDNIAKKAGYGMIRALSDRAGWYKCRRGGRSLSCAPNAEWRKIRPYKLDLILQSSPPGEDVQEKHAWNPDDPSPEILVKDDDKFTAYRNNDDTEAFIRGKMGYSRGFHVWQLTWPDVRSCFLVGVATKDAVQANKPYVGFEQESYGWDVGHGTRYDGQGTRYERECFPLQEFQNVVGLQKFYCILDMDEGFLAFATDETYLGVAFRGLKGKTLYPVVTFSWFCYEITMKYLGGLNGSSSTESDESEGVENPARGDDNISNQLAEDEIKEKSIMIPPAGGVCMCYSIGRICPWSLPPEPGSSFCKYCLAHSVCRKWIRENSTELDGSSSTESDESKGIENPAREDDNIANQNAEDGIKENSTESDESEDVVNPAREDDNIANQLEDVVTDALSDFTGWNKDRARTAVKHTVGAAAGSLGMNAGGVPVAALMSLLTFLPFINSGSTPDGSTGEKNDEDDRGQTNNDNNPRSFFENLLGNVVDLSRKAASECEEESLRRLEANGWNREQMKNAIGHVGGAIFGGIGMSAGGPYAAVASTVIGGLLPNITTLLGSAAVETTSKVVDAIERTFPEPVKKLKDFFGGDGERDLTTRVKQATSEVVDAIGRHIPETINNIKDFFCGDGERDLTTRVKQAASDFVNYVSDVPGKVKNHFTTNESGFSFSFSMGAKELKNLYDGGLSGLRDKIKNKAAEFFEKPKEPAGNDESHVGAIEKIVKKIKDFIDFVKNWGGDEEDEEESDESKPKRGRWVKIWKFVKNVFIAIVVVWDIISQVVSFFQNLMAWLKKPEGPSPMERLDESITKVLAEVKWEEY